MFVYGYNYGGYAAMPGGYTTGSSGFASLANYLSDVNYYTGYSYGGFSNYMTGGGWSPGTFYTYSPTNYMSSFWGGPAGFGYYFGYGNPGYAWGGPNYFGHGYGSSYGFDPYYGGYNPNHYDYLRNNQPSNQSNEQTNNNSNGGGKSGGSKKTGGSSSASEAAEKTDDKKPVEEKADPKTEAAAAKTWEKDKNVRRLSRFINGPKGKGNGNGLRKVELDSERREIHILPYKKYGDLKNPADKEKYLKGLGKFLKRGKNAEKLIKLINALPKDTVLVVGPEKTRLTEPQKLTYEELLKARGAPVPGTVSAASPALVKSDGLPADTPDVIRQFVKNFSGDGKTIGRPIIKVEKTDGDFNTKLTYLPDVEKQDQAVALRDGLKLLAALKPFKEWDNWDNIYIMGKRFGFDKVNKTYGEKFVARVAKGLGLAGKPALAKGDTKGGGTGSSDPGKGRGKLPAQKGKGTGSKQLEAKAVADTSTSLKGGISLFESKNSDPDGAELESATLLCDRYPNIITMDNIEDLLNSSDGKNNFPAIYARFEERKAKYLGLLSRYWAGLVKQHGLEGLPFKIETESGHLLSKKLPIDKAKEKLSGKAQFMKAQKALAAAERTPPVAGKRSPKGQAKLSAADQAEIKYAERMCRRYKHFMSMDDKILQSLIKPDGVNNKGEIFNHMIAKRGIFEKPLKEFWRKEMTRLGLGESKSIYLKAQGRIHSKTLATAEAKEYLKAEAMKEYQTQLATFWASEIKRLGIKRPLKSWADVWAIVAPKNWSFGQAKEFLAVLAPGMERKSDPPKEQLADRSAAQKPGSSEAQKSGSGEVPKLGSGEVDSGEVKVAELSTDGEKWLGKLAVKVKSDKTLAAAVNTNDDGLITEEELLFYQLVHGDGVKIYSQKVTFNLKREYRDKILAKLDALRKEFGDKYKAQGFSFSSEDIAQLTGGQISKTGKTIKTVSPEYRKAAQEYIAAFVQWMAGPDGFNIGYTKDTTWKQYAGKNHDEILDVNKVIDNQTGACTEKTNFLLAAMSLAGARAKPIYVYDQNSSIFLGNNEEGSVKGHVCASVDWVGDTKAMHYDYNSLDNYLPHHLFVKPVSMRQYLSVIIINRAAQINKGSKFVYEVASKAPNAKVLWYKERPLFKQARLLYEWAHSVDPENEVVNIQLADVYMDWSRMASRAGKRKTAIKYMEKVLSHQYQAAKTLDYCKIGKLNDYAAKLYSQEVFGKGREKDNFVVDVARYMELIRRLPRGKQIAKLDHLLNSVVDHVLHWSSDNDFSAENLELLRPIVARLNKLGATKSTGRVLAKINVKVDLWFKRYETGLAQANAGFEDYKLNDLPPNVLLKLNSGLIKDDELPQGQKAYNSWKSAVRGAKARIHYMRRIRQSLKEMFGPAKS